VSTSLSDVAELMSELFPEERAKKLDVVANILKSEDGLDLSDTSAVQRSRGAEPRSSSGSIEAPRSNTRAPGGRTPASVRAPSGTPSSVRPEPARREPTGAVRTQPVEDAAVAEEATTQSTMDLADMLEPPSEQSLTLQLGGAPQSRLSSSSGPMRSRWMLVAGSILVLLGVAVFVIVASGVLESAPSDAPIPTLATASPASSPPTTSSRQPTEPPDDDEGTELPRGMIAPPATDSPAVPDVVPSTTDVPPAEPSAETPDAEDGEAEDGEAETPEAQDGEAEAGEAAPVEGTRRARRGSLNIAARGGWADLFIDGRAAGRTPRSVSLTPGRHVVELRPPGAAPIRRAVTIRSRRTRRLVIDL